jgi:hypothetical protein
MLGCKGYLEAGGGMKKGGSNQSMSSPGLKWLWSNIPLGMSLKGQSHKMNFFKDPKNQISTF